MVYAPRRPDTRRLTQAGEFQAVLKDGARFSGKRFVLRALGRPDASAIVGAGAARLGLIAGRKAAKRAVDRNRAKRLAREMFRLSRANLPTCDLVLQLREDLRGSANHEVRAELTRLLREVQRRAPAKAPAQQT